MTVTDATDRDGLAAREVRLLADWARCDLIETAIEASDVAEALPRMVAALPEPQGEPSLPWAWFAAETASRANMRAVLDAAGADEVLLCHPGFDHARTGGLAARLKAWLGRTSAPSPPSLPEDWNALLGPAARGIVTTPALAAPPLPAWIANDPLAACGFADLKGRLLERTAPGLDAMMQGHGIEARLPFLDESLLNYALALPGAVRAPSRMPRQTLRRLLGDLAPAAAMVQPPLSALPLAAWLAGPLGQMVDTLAARSPLVRGGVLSADAIRALLSRHRQHHDRATVLWGLAVLLAWCDSRRIDGLETRGTSVPALAHSRS